MSLFNKINFLHELDEKLAKTIKLFFIPVEHEVLFITNDNNAFSFTKINNKNVLILMKELCGLKIKKFTSSLTNNFALSFKGHLYKWSTEFCQSSDGLTNNCDTPRLMKSLLHYCIIDICCSFNHTIVLTHKGIVMSFGQNSFGQIGNNTILNQNSPVVIASLENVCSISCGLNHSIAKTKNGEVFLWGDNSFGQLSEDNNSSELCPFKLNICNVDKYKKIACGENCSLMLTNDGDLYFCGRLSDSESYKKPVQLNNDVKIDDIAVILTLPTIIVLSKNNKCFYVDISKESQKLCLIETDFENLDEAFIHYSGKQITFRCIEMGFVNSQHVTSSSKEMDIEKLSSFENRIQIIGKLGKGEFGSVYKCIRLQDNKIFAVKNRICNPGSNYYPQSICNEVMSSSNLKSDFVVKNIETWMDENKPSGYDITDNDENINMKEELCSSAIITIYTLMELYPFSLRDAINIIKKKCFDLEGNKLSILGYYIASELLYELLECVQYIHSKLPAIIHRNLKPENILITNSFNKRFVRLSDFGLSTFHRANNQSHTQYTGNRNSYTAPEIYDSTHYTTKADIFSLGIILQELFSIEISDTSKQYLPYIKHKMVYIQTLIARIFYNRPSDRPTCDHILEDENLWRYRDKRILLDENYKKYINKSPNSIDENFIAYFVQSKHTELQQTLRIDWCSVL